MFKTRITEKTMINKKKLYIESLLNLSKKDFLFIFNVSKVKINKQKRKNTNIFIITFPKPIVNKDVFFLNFFPVK